VVPFGVPDTPPAPPSDGSALRGGRFPGIGPEAKVLLWGGGTWDWFDPLGTLDAFLAVQQRVPEARLFFMGLELEGRGVPEMSTTRRLVERLRDEQLVERGLVAVGPWVPYDERSAYLVDAHVGVVAAKDLAESRLAFRTRMLDHFWAGLPTLATSGDVLAELVERSGAGLVVAPNDVDAMAAAMERLLTDEAFHARARQASSELAGAFRWSAVVEPIAELLVRPGPWRAARASRQAVRGAPPGWSALAPGTDATVAPAPSAAVLAERDALAAEVSRLRSLLADGRGEPGMTPGSAEPSGELPERPVVPLRSPIGEGLPHERGATSLRSIVGRLLGGRR
jgi:hypothetical protein